MGHLTYSRSDFDIHNPWEYGGPLPSGLLYPSEIIMAIEILVYGDSYANWLRFNYGIEKSLKDGGIQAKVQSIGLPGQDLKMLLSSLKPLRNRFLALGAFDIMLLVAGVNDIAKRRGADGYAESLELLIRECQHIARQVFVLEIPHFDEMAILGNVLHRTKRGLLTLLRDPKPGRVERYRSAAASIPGIKIIGTTDFLPTYDASRFKDGIHLTDAEFDQLAEEAGKKLLAWLSSSLKKPLADASNSI